MNLYQEALAIKDTAVSNRRYLHQIPETGLHLPKTAAYVEEKLKEMLKTSGLEKYDIS